MLQVGYKFARRFVIFIVGMSVIIVGIVMFVPLVPGPGFIIIPLGLAILATEFVWAKIMLKKLKEKSADGAQTIKDWFFKKTP
ncbi:MAG TPA: PGPGW domain-containing protein [Bdellovibrionota bacterium]|nr:PGPGW domain-containing protein [Bdellovibrionota bacterium]